ncbi:MAG: ABC transporter permease subunit [Verrucomicrobiaceae bacterium]|nr:ABC transporter permease subunit [Verrucomicrobiaceae bacterium]
MIIGTLVALFCIVFKKSFAPVALTLVGVMDAMGPILPPLAVLSALQIKSEFLISLVLGAMTWNSIAIFLWDEVSTLINAPYVQAARVVGATMPRVLIHHIIPNILPRIVPLTLALFVSYAGLMGALGFLGVASDASHSLGFMVYDAKSYCRQNPAYFIGSLSAFLVLIVIPNLLVRVFGLLIK